jgi:uncharacterized Ntn-hydrolase superfamily protein
MTYSVVAVDATTKQMGVAVQSHYFASGAIVPWAEAGVGVVATQSIARIEYGPRGLALMRAGKTAGEALAECLADDPEAAVRQVAMADATGNAAVHTGERCIAEAGHVLGEAFATQANMMRRDTVWSTMAAAFGSAAGDFPSRLLAALRAAEDEGGDIRGRQSAGLLIVSTAKPESIAAPEMSLRVDDHPEPLDELTRLVRLWRAYRHADAGDAYLAAGDRAGATEAYEKAALLAPDNTELAFWRAVSLHASGATDEALAVFADVFARQRRWASLVARLPESGLFTPGEAAMSAILREAHDEAPW